MFSGIIEVVGTVLENSPRKEGRRLHVQASSIAKDCQVGASIAVSGVCLTVCHIQGDMLEFDVVHETLNRSTLARKREGDGVNLERSLRAGDRIDGHFVQGHVDGMARVARIERNKGEHVVWLEAQPAVLPYLVPKGSVAIDGVSLTIAKIEGNCFSVALIPTTLERTTLRSYSTGEMVNLESDVLARIVAYQFKLHNMHNGGLTVEHLRQAGFA